MFKVRRGSQEGITLVQQLRFAGTAVKSYLTSKVSKHISPKFLVFGELPQHSKKPMMLPMSSFTVKNIMLLVRILP